MTKVWFINPASFTIRSILALPVKWGTSNLPPLIASTLGSVDQIKCLTPASLAARTAAVACFSSSVPCSQKLVTRKTPCALQTQLSGFRGGRDLLRRLPRRVRDARLDCESERGP